MAVHHFYHLFDLVGYDQPNNQLSDQPINKTTRKTLNDQAVNHLALIHKAVHGGGAERLRHGGATQLNSEIFCLQSQIGPKTNKQLAV